MRIAKDSDIEPDSASSIVQSRRGFDNITGAP
jgi:hypothetical protein